MTETPSANKVSFASKYSNSPGVSLLAAPCINEGFAQILYITFGQASTQGMAEVVVKQQGGDGIAVAIRDRLSRAANGR